MRLLYLLLLCTTAFAATKPNVIVIISDDHGWADASFQKLPASRDVRTPHLDRLFASGLRFTQGYVASSTCGPSRSSLMTGRTSSRFGLEDNQPGTPLEGPPASEILIPRILKPVGYHTGAIGKWHLGGVNRPLRSGKGSVFDGGVRVLFGASWPGVLPQGRDYDGVLSSVDIFTTTAALAGVPVPRDRVIDGVDLMPYLTGKKTEDPHEEFFFRRLDRKSWALRAGEFKWVVAPKEGIGATGALFRIGGDIGEERDVSAEFPEKKKQLIATYERLTAGLPRPVNHSTKPDPDDP